MKLIRFLAIVFFDIIDKYFHQVKILNFLKKNKVTIRSFFDIGAHIGESSKKYCQLFKNAQIYSFEPSPDSYKVLNTLNFKNLKIYNFGFSNKKDT